MAETDWRGFLRLQLVSINVELYAATEAAAEIKFNQIHKPSGQRVKYQKVVSGIGEVDATDIVKGYQVEADRYVTIEPAEFEAIRLESKRTIDMLQFIDTSEIDPRYFERPYYIVPADEMARKATSSSAMPCGRPRRSESRRSPCTGGSTWWLSCRSARAWCWR